MLFGKHLEEGEAEGTGDESSTFSKCNTDATGDSSVLREGGEERKRKKITKSLINIFKYKLNCR